MSARVAFLAPPMATEPRSVFPPCMMNLSNGDPDAYWCVNVSGIGPRSKATAYLFLVFRAFFTYRQSYDGTRTTVIFSYTLDTGSCQYHLSSVRSGEMKGRERSSTT